MDTVEAGRMGGKTTAKRYGKEHFVRLGRKNRKPDNQVTAGAIYQRAYRAGYRKRRDPRLHPPKPKVS